MTNIHDTFRREGLVRTEDRVIAGVCASLGRRLGLDPWPARLLFVLLLFVVPGSPIVLYPILWVLMPRATTATAPTTPTVVAPTS